MPCLVLGWVRRPSYDPLRPPSGTAAQSNDRRPGLAKPELSVVRSSVRDMETTRTTRALRVVRPDEAPAVEPDELSVEDYWAQVQALRADLARLRPAN